MTKRLVSCSHLPIQLGDVGQGTEGFYRTLAGLNCEEGKIDYDNESNGEEVCMAVAIATMIQSCILTIILLCSA